MNSVKEKNEDNQKEIQVNLKWFILRVNNKRYEGEIKFQMKVCFNDIVIKMGGQNLEKEGECQIVRFEKEKIILGN